MKAHSHSIPHRKAIEAAILELIKLGKNEVHTVPKVNWWLLKYENLYHYCKENWNMGSCIGDLPCCYTIGSPEDKFRDLYKVLDELTVFHKNEKTFDLVMEEFYQVENKPASLLEWLKKNEHAGSDEYLLFWIDWAEDDKFITPFPMPFEEVEIKIAQGEFKNTLKFLQTFNKYYWDSSLADKQ